MRRLYARMSKPSVVSPINKRSNEVRSPLSGKVVLRYDPETGITERFLCDDCVRLIKELGKTHALDPVFFWGAGVFDYQVHATPLGTKAFLNADALGSFIRSMSYDMKKNWEEVTGLPFPFKYVKGRKRMGGKAAQ